MLLTVTERTADYCMLGIINFKPRVLPRIILLHMRLNIDFFPEQSYLKEHFNRFVKLDEKCSCFVAAVKGIFTAREMNMFVSCFFFKGALLTVELLKNDVKISVEEGKETILRVSE